MSFASYAEQFGRAYAGGLAEYQERRTLFDNRAAEVFAHNRNPHRRWTAAINAFSDRSVTELARLRGWRRRGSPTELARHGSAGAHNQHGSHGGHHQHESSLSLRQQESNVRAPLAKQVSWAFLNSSKRHYNQGSCGSCWAIASAGVLEAHSEIAFGDNARTFSAQELVSCVQNPRHCGGDGGCEGATIELAMEWAIKHGLSEDSAVPYRADEGECRAMAAPEGASLLQIQDRGGVRRSGPAQEDLSLGSTDAGLRGMSFGMLGWERLPENHYESLQRALQDGPVGVSVAASDWFGYGSGIFDRCDRDAVIDHAVVLQGYGEDAGDGYWLVKNSWGMDWGENGLMRLLRRQGEVDEGSWCGVDRQPELGSGCDGGPSEVRVCGTCGILYDTVAPKFVRHPERTKQLTLMSAPY